jgi:hypothetical protein
MRFPDPGQRDHQEKYLGWLVSLIALIVWSAFCVGAGCIIGRWLLHA